MKTKELNILHKELIHINKEHQKWSKVYELVTDELESLEGDFIDAYEKRIVFENNYNSIFLHHSKMISSIELHLSSLIDEAKQLQRKIKELENK